MKFYKKLIILIFLYLVAPASIFSAEMGDDGLHKQTWMRDTFKDLREDLDAVSYTHLRAHETLSDLVCRLLLEKKNYLFLQN